MNPRLLLLTLCQGLFMTNNVTLIAINGLVGLALAPRAWMATLPVMAYVTGSALSAGLVARHQRAWGRKRAFQAGLAVGMLTTAVAAYAAYAHLFWLLVGATLVAGYYNANAALYASRPRSWSRPRSRSVRSRGCWPAASSARWPGRISRTRRAMRFRSRSPAPMRR